MNATTTETTFHQQLIALVEALLAEAGAPGAAVAVLLDGETILEAGIGYRDAASTMPLPADARFYLYSLTKTLIAAAILQYVGRGALALDEPVQRYLPDLSLPAPIAVRRLLNHSAALPDYGGLAVYHEAVKTTPGRPWPPERFLQIAAAPEPSPPSWRYSNVGYLILKLLLEKVSGRSLRQALYDQLFAPLRLADSFVAESLGDAVTLTPAHSRILDPDGELQDITGHYHPGWVAHGVVISSARDVARLMLALFAGELLLPELRTAMAEPVLLPFDHPLFRRPAYGLGVMIDAASPHGLIIGHAGGGPGYATAALCLPDTGGHSLVTVAMANRDAPDLGLALAYRLAEATAQVLQP
jgi:D-alanyl-D-alanine carboxypeptidase